MLSFGARLAATKTPSATRQRRHIHSQQGTKKTQGPNRAFRQGFRLGSRPTGSTTFTSSLPALVTVQKRHLELNTSTLLLLTKVREIHLTIDFDEFWHFEAASNLLSKRRNGKFSTCLSRVMNFQHGSHLLYYLFHIWSTCLIQFLPSGCCWCFRWIFRFPLS